jgi:DNA-binding winged helix-turn-helix (wHTH) protein
LFQDHSIPNTFNSSSVASSQSGLALQGLLELPVKELLRRGNLRVEKCELKEAGQFFELALEKAKKTRDFRGMSDSIAHLLRHSSEIGDDAATKKWVSELETFLAQQTGKSELTPHVWYCQGIVAFRNAQYKKAQILFHRFWREVEAEENQKSTEVSAEQASANYREGMRSKAQALLALAVVAHAQGKIRRAQYFGEVILNYAERERPRGILSSTYLMLCRLAERTGNTAMARQWLQKAFAESVSEHNWYHYLFVLYGFARVSRLDQDFIQARFYLDLLEKAVVQDEFKNLRQEIAEERVKLNLNRVDLEIDLNRSVIRSREGEINLRRQHLLIEILHQLAKAHDHGMAKSEIIEKVWGEAYNPEAHDGKLYYNINRIRKLIEPDQKKPQYLLNWRQGYRLAPELKIRVIQGETSA